MPELLSIKNHISSFNSNSADTLAHVQIPLAKQATNSPLAWQQLHEQNELYARTKARKHEAMHARIRRRTYAPANKHMHADTPTNEPTSTRRSKLKSRKQCPVGLEKVCVLSH